tara:strand:+ start:73 stop:240 length:168 start_codon:yes stop_codon:yes gene_type:complete
MSRHASAPIWAETLAQLLRDQARRQRLQAAATTVRERFSDTILARQLIQALERLG